MKYTYISSGAKICSLLFTILFLLSCRKSGEETKMVDSPAPKASVDSVNVIKMQILTELGRGSFYYPQFSADGQKLFLTKSNYRGIYYYNFKNEELIELNTQPAAGYQYQIGPQQKKVYYRAEVPGQKRLRQYMLFEQDIQSKKTRTLLKKPSRSVQPPGMVTANTLVYRDGKDLKLISLKGVEEAERQAQLPVMAMKSASKLRIIKNSRDVFDQDFNRHPIIWTDWNSDRNRLLFYVSGVGLHLFELSDKNSRILGNFRAARWAPFENMFAYMLDKDDGHRITASDIYTFHLRSQRSVNITNTADVIELYPNWSADGKFIACHTPEGQIMLLHLRIN